MFFASYDYPTDMIMLTQATASLNVFTAQESGYRKHSAFNITTAFIRQYSLLLCAYDV